MERLRAGSSWTDHDLVFATRRGGPIERTEDWRVWKAILAQAQVRDARVHDARHTAATLLIEQGVHIRVVQEVLGHTRVTTTERYTHVATLQMKDASERLGQALWGRAMRATATQTATFGRTVSKALSLGVRGEGL